MKEFLKKQVPVTTVLIIIAIMAVAPSMCAQMFKMLANEVGYDDTVTQLGLYGDNANVQKAIEAVDSNIDNIHLVTGPTGPTGIEGPTGAIGPEGKLSETLLVSVRFSTEETGFDIMSVFIPENAKKLKGKIWWKPYPCSTSAEVYFTLIGIGNSTRDSHGQSSQAIESKELILDNPPTGWHTLRSACSEYTGCSYCVIANYSIYIEY